MSATTEKHTKSENKIDHTVKEVEIGLKESQRSGVTALLQQVLADQIVLYTKTRNFHWNVVGPRFHTLHVFLEEQYQSLQEKSDEVAERIRSLGGFAAGSMAEYLKHTRLHEQPAGSFPSASEILQILTDDHEAVIRNLRKDLEKAEEEYGDMGTNDFLTGLMEAHEKLAWMLRAHLTDKD